MCEQRLRDGDLGLREGLRREAGPRAPLPASTKATLQLPSSSPVTQGQGASQHQAQKISLASRTLLRMSR